VEVILGSARRPKTPSNITERRDEQQGREGKMKKGYQMHFDPLDVGYLN
jgi:hypothetical protein